MTDSYRVGQLVELSDGRTAVVRFVGTTSFAGGDWIGVSFEESCGKNDGSVQGQRYFECDPGHGMFLRPTGIGQVLEEPTPKAPAKKAVPNGKAAAPSASGAVKTRPSSIMGQGLKRPSNDPAASKRQSINAPSPSPVPRPSINGRKSPTKLATRTVGSSSRGATPPASTRKTTSTAAITKPSYAPRPSITGARAQTTSTASATRTTRTSISGTNSATGGRPGTTAPTTRTASTTAPRPARTSLAPSSRLANGTAAPQKQKSPEAPVESSAEPDLSSEQTTSPQHSPNSSDLSHEDASANFAPPPTESAEPSPTREAAVKGPPRTAAPTSRHIQDLETKIKTLEKQAEEYRERLANFEKLQSEKDRFQGIIDRLQAKLQPQSQELSEIRKKLKESQTRLDEAESKDADHETSLEAALLDREAAEVEKEMAQSELNALKDKLEELKLDVEVLREENDTLKEDVSPEERQSQSWLHRERENERLREALMRLRDMSQDTETELKSQVSELEQDLKQLDGIKEEYDEIKEKLRASEAAVSDLKEQLDEALDAENTTERLTAENMALQDQVDELKVNIQELEDLKELNDELEYNHIEAEKQMQEELDFKDTFISEQSRQASQQEDKLADYEYTITKFRELVQNLQSHLEDMRASQQITEAEAEELTNRSKAMTDLNMKLQSSAEKAQINTIDLESRRLEAQEAIEHLAIVQMFLPESFKTERESILTYLRFRRIAAKSRLLHTLLKNKISGDSPTSSEDAFTLCDLLDKLVWIAAICDRFVSRISSASLEEFVRFESALYELDPVERGLNVYIDNVKSGELKEQAAAEELQRSTSLLSHLAEMHIKGDDLADYAEDVIMRTSLMQSYLENTATAISLTRATAMPSKTSSEDLDPEDSLTQFSTEAQSFISHTRSAKVVATKAHQALTDLKTRSMCIEPFTSSSFTDAQDATFNLAQLARQLGAHLRNALSSADLSASDDTSTSRDTVRTALHTFCSSHLPDTTSTNPLTVLAQKLKHTATLISQILDLSNNISSASEFTRPEPPWQQRATSMRTAKQTSHNTEQELIRLKDTLQSQAQQLRARDQSLEESSVKIELLESRTRDAAEKAGRISELQAKLDEGRKRERELARSVEEHVREVKSLAAERDHWRGVASTKRQSRTPNEGGQGEEAGEGDADERHHRERANVSTKEMEALRAEVQGLQGTVRYLREESRRTKLARPDEPHMAWLREPLFKQRRRDEGSGERLALKRQGKDVFAALRSVVENADGLIDLRVTIDDGQDRLKWRPAREKNAWKVARHTEQWAVWRAKGTAFVERAKEVERTREAIAKKHESLVQPRNGNGNGKEVNNERRSNTTAEAPGIEADLAAKSAAKQVAFDSGIAGLEPGEQFHEALSNAGDVGVAH